MTSLRSRLAERPPWLVRFPRAHNNSVAGAGVLVGPRHVVTCAHVVDLQLGRHVATPGRSPAAPVDDVEVDFPFAGQTGRVGTRLRAKVVGWEPIAADDSGDVALLELAAPVDHTPAPLAFPPALSDHRFSVHGFPRGEAPARQATGVLRGASGEVGQWVQLDADSLTGWAVQEGFSGAPVFDHSAEAVVGIVTMRDRHRTGHVLPISYLRMLWPEVRRNCGWRLDLDPSYRTHWRPRARGSEIDSDTGEWFFTGRTKARSVICDWLEDNTLAEHPILLVTGGPGSGKSALLAHLLVSADPRLGETVPTSGPRPVAGAFDAALHLRGRTCDDTADQLASVFGVAASNRDELLAAVGEFPPGGRFTVLADAVEEAATLGEAQDIANLLRRLANTGRIRVLAGVRTAPDRTPRSRILGAFGKSAPRIDLEAPEYLHHSDIAEYVRRRLNSQLADPRRYRAYPPDQLRALGESVARKARFNFLIAQLATGWLARRSTPLPEVGGPAWEDELPETIGQAMDAYLDTCGPDTEAVRRLLTALAYARGDGLPRGHTWLRIADALSYRPGHTLADLDNIFYSAAHYLVERVDEDTEPRTYRLYHEALDQHLREQCIHHAPQQAITSTLIDTVPERHGQRNWAAADTYTLNYLAFHATAAGHLDETLAETEYLVHAAPRSLILHLPHASTESARLTAAIYRTSIGLHASTTAAVRRQVLALDAARAGASTLQQQLTDHIPKGDWSPLWSTGGTFSSALRDTLTGHRGPVPTVACTVLDGTSVAVTGGVWDGDATVRVWDLRTGMTMGQPLTGHTGGVSAVACTVVDGTPVAVTGSSDKTIRLWDLRTGTPIGQPLDHTREVWAAACTVVDGTPVAVTVGSSGIGATGLVRVWDLRTGTPVSRPLISDTGWVSAVACTVVDGTPVAVTGSVDGSVRVWDLRAGAPVGQPLTGHTGNVSAVACTVVDGTPVAVTGSVWHGDNTVRVWDLRTGAPMGQPLTGHTGEVYAVACTVMDGSPVAVTGSGDGSVRVWDLRAGAPMGQPLTGHTGMVRGVACAVVNGSPVAVTGGDDGSVRVWDMRPDTPVGQPRTGHTGLVSGVACAVVDGSPVAVTGSSDKTLRVWDLRAGSPMGQPLTGHTDIVQAVACAVVDGASFAVSGSRDGSVQVWDLRAGAPIGQPLTGHGSDGRAVACTVVAGILVVITTGHMDMTLRIWDPHTSDPIGQLPTTHEALIDVIVCTVVDDAPVVVTGSRDRSVRVWDLRTGTPIGRPLTGHADWVSAAACTVVDGTPVAVTGSRDGSVRVWDLQAVAPFGQPLIGHTDEVFAVACAVVNGVPVAATSSRDDTVRVWDLRTGKPAGLVAVTMPVAVALSSEGNLVLGADDEVAVFRQRPAHTLR